MIKKNKEKVLIYSMYNENNIDNGLKEEQAIKNYCKDNNYEAIEIVRKALPYRLFQVVENFMDILKKHNIYYDAVDFKKLIVYDIRDLVPDNSSLLTLLMILKEGKVALESIVQGKLNFNPLDKEDILSDDFEFEHYICSRNKKYFVE